jgi:tetratricopeptide (TPR) repeat protein
MANGCAAEQQSASSEETLGQLRAQCAAQPGQAEPRIHLATALLALRRAAEAVVPMEQAVALAPGLAEAARVREAVLGALLAGDPDLVKLELAAALAPDDGQAHLSLGAAYVAVDRAYDAERCFKLALALGRTSEANADLASLYLAVGMLDAADHYAKAVLAGEHRGVTDDVLFAMAAQTLASVAQAKGETEAAEAWLDQAYARRSVFRQRVGDCPFTTLVLVSRRQGNIAYRNLLPPLRSDCLVWYMEHARLEQAADLPAYAVVLNAIGDPDVAMASDAVVEAFTAGCGRPVINPPARVRATFRHVLEHLPTLRTRKGIP